MRPVWPPRALSEAASQVIAAAIARAPFVESTAPAAGLDANVRVVGLCDCGCDSLFFDGIEAATRQYRVADGVGDTLDGEEIGVILWASEGRLVHLELYNYSERPARLPLADTLRPYGEAKRTRE